MHTVQSTTHTEPQASGQLINCTVKVSITLRTWNYMDPTAALHCWKKKLWELLGFRSFVPILLGHEVAAKFNRFAIYCLQILVTDQTLTQHHKRNSQAKMSCTCHWLWGGPAIFTPSAETDEKYETLTNSVRIFILIPRRGNSWNQEYYRNILQWSMFSLFS